MTQLELGSRERIRRAARTGSAIARIYLGYKGLDLLDRGPLRRVVRVARRRWDHLSAAALGGAAERWSQRRRVVRVARRSGPRSSRSRPL